MGLIEEATTVSRWTRRLLVGAIAILVPALAGCEAGLNAPTLQFHPAANGYSTTFNGITIDNVFVLGPPLNSTLPTGSRAGVFLSLQSQDNDRLVSVSAPGTALTVTLTGGPIRLTPYDLVDLSGPTPHIVLNGLTSPLSAGTTVKLNLTFANAGQTSLVVPVEPNAYDYATYSPPPPTPTASPTPTGKHKHKKGAGASPSASTTGTASPSPSATS
jgi:copper(I)-binding protein